MRNIEINKTAEITIVRQFNASRNRVFEAFADAKSMAEWWGPPAQPITVLKYEFIPNGMFHYKMEANGNAMYGRFIFGEIRNPELLEFTNAFSDKDGGITRAPFSAMWPLEVFNRLTFTEQDGKTTIIMNGYPVNATDEENEMFMQAQANLKQGLEGTFMQLEQYLRK